jgi:hypothetical protein
MKFDELGLLVSETCEGPGQLGDSCANTARLIHLKYILGALALNVGEETILDKFFTDKGTIRHPDSIWRENDQSSDQDLALYIALGATKQEFYATRLWVNTLKRGWRTGNGDLCSPIFLAILKRSWLIHLLLAGQALLFRVPIRWNDEKKRLTWEPNASGDFLNWFHAAAYTKSLAIRLVTREMFMDAVRRYFKPEPNSDWIVALYSEASAKVWR